MHIKNKRGQSTVEYILLVTAVVAVIIVFVGSQGKGGFQEQFNSTLNSATTEMGSMADKFSGSHSTPPDMSGNAGTPPYNVDVTPGKG